MTDLLHTRVRSAAERYPDATAIVLENESVSYAELMTRTHQLANALSSGGLARGERVLVLAPKTPDTIAALIATMQAGGVYVPADPGSPAPRLAKVLDASEPRWIVSVPECAALLDGMLAEIPPSERPSILSLSGPIVGNHCVSDIAREDWTRAPSTPPSSRRAPDDIAHLLFTSGSTGIPKGVAITHQNVCQFLNWSIEHFGITHGDRNSGHAPLHFDLSTFDIFATLSAGAELHLVSPEANRLPHKLAEMIRQSELTQWFSVPSVLGVLAKLDVVKHGDFPSLRRLLWCGEVLPTPTLRHFMERVPHARYCNLYGPTEATIASTFYDVTAMPVDPCEPIPIGVPCTGEDVILVDDQLREVADGATGELCIRGVGLSPGYWRDPAKTEAAFVPDLADPQQRMYRTGDLARRDDAGIVHFIGRADTQIKSRGYRIELGEIETALHSLAILDDVAVVAIPTEGFEGHRICCAYVPATPEVTQQDLRKSLATLLPSYMVPSRWIALDELPANVNGKVDRPTLRGLFSGGVKAPA